MAIALDVGGGSPGHNNATAGSVAASLSTSNANCIIIAVITTNGGPVSSVTTSPSSLSFSLRVKAVQDGNSALTLEIWQAVASSTLSSETITANLSSSNFTTVDVFGISGADTSTINDSNGSIPAKQETNFNTVSATTSNANDFLIGAYRFKGASGTSSAGSGWTAIGNTDYQLCEYQIVAATSTYTALIGTLDGNEGCGVFDAVIQATGGGGGLVGPLTGGGRLVHGSLIRGGVLAA